MTTFYNCPSKVKCRIILKLERTNTFVTGSEKTSLEPGGSAAPERFGPSQVVGPMTSDEGCDLHTHLISVIP